MRLALGISLERSGRPDSAATPKAPSNIVAPAITGNLWPGQVLSCATGTWSGSSPIVYAYQWYVDGAPETGATDATWEVTPEAEGLDVYCEVTGTNGVGADSVNSNTVTIISAPVAPANTIAPVVSGNLQVGQMLSCTDGTWTGTAPITYTYQWHLNDSPVVGASSSSYVIPGEAENGDEIHCEVTAVNIAGTDTALSNTVSVEVDEGGVPVISGTAYPGNTLTSTLSGQWYLNDSPISGETGSTLALAYTAVEPGDDISQLDSNVLTVQSYDTDAATDIAAVISAGSDWGTTDGERRNNKWRYSELITAWKAAGAYSTSYFYRVLAGPTSLNGIFACGRNGSVTNTNFVSGDLNRLTGLKGSTNKYLNSGVPTNMYPTDDCLVGLYLTETITTGPVGGAAVFGDAGSGVAGSIQLFKDSTDRPNIRVRSSGALMSTVAAPSTWARFTSLGRNNGSTCEFHTNGASETEALTSSGSLTAEMYFYSRAGNLISDPRAALLWFSNFEDEAAIDGPMQTYLANLI